MKDRHPYKATGILKESEGIRMIELDSTVSENTSLSGEHLPVGTPVRLLYWTNDPTGAPTEIEAISEIQQLELSVVAHGLEAEGSLYAERKEFLQRLSVIEQ